MNFAENFNYIGNIDAAALQSLVADLSEEQWTNDPFRQKKYEVHKDTQMIALVFDPDFRHSHPTRLPLLQVFEQALRPVLEMSADHYENTPAGQELIKEFGLGYFIRTTLVRLKSGGTIAAHQDMNFSLSHSHRIHVPIVTNDNVDFQVGEETINMRPGEVIEINNRRMHSVHNLGDSARVHLILDFVLPGEMCCCGRKRHPNSLCSPNACMDTDHLRIPCDCHPEN